MPRTDANTGRSTESRLLRRRLLRAQREKRQAQKRAEELKRRLADQVLLVREVDHRAKNSLQLAASMLALQARATDSLHLSRELNDAVRRLNSLADVHAALYRSGEGGEAPVKEWLNTICRGLAVRSDVAIRVDCSEAKWPLPIAGPVGLFASEAVANALKHAFPNRAGRIAVVIEERDGGWRRLSVSDDGEGCAHFEGGLGFRLLHTFARQLGGVLRTEDGETGRGLSVAVDFRVPGEATSPH